MGDLLPSVGVVFSPASFAAGPREGVEEEDWAVDRGARMGYDFGLGSRSTIGGNGAAVGGATAVDIFTGKVGYPFFAGEANCGRRIHGYANDKNVCCRSNSI